MIVYELCPTDSNQREEPSSAEAPSEKAESESSDSKLAALRALGAVGFHIVHYSYEDSKFRVQVIGPPQDLCVELSSQEYFRFSQAMDAQLETEPKVLEEVNSTDECVTELSSPDIAKETVKSGRYLRKLLPMLRFKGRSEKDTSQLQMRQRISLFMLCLLRLFEKKKKPAGKAATSSAESTQEDLKVENSVAVSS